MNERKQKNRALHGGAISIGAWLPEAVKFAHEKENQVLETKYIMANYWKID